MIAGGYVRVSTPGTGIGGFDETENRETSSPREAWAELR
jgi:hypothetical protein